MTIFLVTHSAHALFRTVQRWAPSFYSICSSIRALIRPARRRVSSSLIRVNVLPRSSPYLLVSPPASVSAQKDSFSAISTDLAVLLSSAGLSLSTEGSFPLSRLSVYTQFALLSSTTRQAAQKCNVSGIM